MYFDSTIPQGYGVGSSGALVLSMTNMLKTKSRFSREPYSRKIITVKKHIFSNGAFSRKSSGLDL
jgi:mevalonate kinase